ncbi:hypothetical protein [Nocardia brasiliensis]|uniref:hypothetical protein n=1 Tax=Nocardia brasiliensis TaxID=37326 RepID=UPI002457D5FF|nr:hypothetical protein [Nocardia brasiliensis]
MYEPTANARQNARALFDQFTALLQEGFTEAQSLQILGVMLATAMRNGDPGQA